MFIALFLGALSVGAAQDQAQCAIDGAAALDDLTDAGMFAWAASKRCGKPSESQVKCEIDITSAAQSATNMIATIVGAVAQCGAISTESADCAAAVTGLTSAAAGLAAASGTIADTCPNSLNLPAGVPTGTAQQTNLGLCIIDVKGTMTSLFSASKHLSKVGNCKGTALVHDFNSTKKPVSVINSDCAANAAVNIISALADLGSNLAESFNDCSSINGDGNANADCASGVLALASALTGVAQAGKAMKGACTVEASRLYQNREVATGTSSLTVALAAFLPIAAVLSFVVGRRTRARPEQERDVETLTALTAESRLQL